MKIKIIFFFLLISFLTTSCGFKVLNKSENINFFIQEIRTSGEIRINHKIKNNILINSKETSENQVIINLNTKKNKSIKEKNIKNEITKYKIAINVEVRFNEINKNNTEKFLVSKTGDYDAAKQYSQTLENEKKLTELLTDEIAEDILGKLIIKLNAI